MKAIIDGKRYDTETAHLVAEWSNGMSYSDFRHCDEDLYRTPRGNWFVHGTGGPLTDYAKPVGNNGYTGSSRIQPLTADEAREWLEHHGMVKALEKHFASEIEDA